MQELTGKLITVFLGYFAIMNPLANTAVFIGLTHDKTDKTKIALKALIVSFVLIALFAILGKTLFHFFGITLHALRISGGILVFLIGYKMLHGESSSMHVPDNNNDDDVAISPLAVPILAGPGTIATTMNFSATGDWNDILITVTMFALLCVITFFSFIMGPRLLQPIGDSGVDIATRLMGLILTVIAAQMFIEGVGGAITDFQLSK